MGWYGVAWYGIGFLVTGPHADVGAIVALLLLPLSASNEIPRHVTQRHGDTSENCSRLHLARN